jgi:hypothetical protein
MCQQNAEHASCESKQNREKFSIGVAETLIQLHGSADYASDYSTADDKPAGHSQESDSRTMISKTRCHCLITARSPKTIGH